MPVAIDVVRERQDRRFPRRITNKLAFEASERMAVTLVQRNTADEDRAQNQHGYDSADGSP